ncbi:iron chelate uptake ABC transporter family permease subunit [Nocardioides panacisoli]|uniref:FecCD family ABC transporter permease n=1 Tax=Nocardioides panacisoli TaxID=627624 RepID=UPI001C62D9D0|nr:iron chelate uptake ABC transporter family permease subunit [Nocardioides panacisoli]QYJ04189.1 iron chelate uptake ABC transporter family permease subunit [Nocardioides panacisoli]
MTATLAGDEVGTDRHAAALDGIRRTERRRRTRRLVVAVLLFAVTVGSVVVALNFGEITLEPGEVLAVALGGGEEVSRLVLLEFRLPRILLAALIGIGFGLSGALFQSVLRNPLASPDIIGISQGATVGAVTGTLALGLTSGIAVQALAFVGALTVAALNFLVAWRGGLTGQRFVLCGIALAFACTSAIGYLLTRTEVRDAQAAIAWMAGSVGSADYDVIARTAIALVVLVPAALWLASRLGMLEMGDDVASALGVAAVRIRIVAIGVGVLLAAVATAAAGPVPFIALTAAPIARRLVGDGRVALWHSALVGATIAVVADLVAQNALDDAQVPVGVITGLIGGPYLIWVLSLSQRARRG